MNVTIMSKIVCTKNVSIKYGLTTYLVKLELFKFYSNTYGARILLNSFEPYLLMNETKIF